MTLDIIIPHYREPWETCHTLFDTIALQRGINFEDIRVLVVNDGDCLLDSEHFKGYPYRIEYLVKEHGGISAARNYGLDYSGADFVMWCDIDDGFLNNYGLHLVFSAMQESADLYVSNFVEETIDENGHLAIVRHDKDLTFMHGKVYRRSFLIENELRFDPAMTIHEDGYFNMLVYSVASKKDAVKYIETPIYLWQWNPNSTVRRNLEDFVLRTYKEVIQTRTGLCRELKRRGYEEDYRDAVGMTVMNSYYDFQKTSYYTAKNEKYLRVAEREFKAYWTEFGDVFNDLTNREVAAMARAARENALNNGFLFERQTIHEFIRHIEKEVKA